MSDLTRARALCAYCRRLPMEPEWRPFCSKRCKLADLGRWLGEEYRVPVREPASGEADDPADS